MYTRKLWSLARVPISLIIIFYCASCNNIVPLDDSLWPSGDGGSGGDGGQSGLPCDVAQILSTHCWSCHGQVPSVNGPALVSWKDLTATSPSYPGQSIAARSLARMQNSTSTMPPSPASPVSAAELATFQSWVSSGTPQGSCGAPDGGNPFDVPAVCSSGQTWSGGENARMHPGRACISCHSSGEGPSYSIAGTVYPTAHEPNDCNSSNLAGVTVQITDNSAHVITLTPNNVGNFYYQSSLSLPYFAEVLSQGNNRAMSSTQTSGDCNLCHTPTGANGAPGRIIPP